jgi:hypothetical protein
MSGPEGVYQVPAPIQRLIDQLEADFPDWRISREEADRWVAVRRNWGALYGQNAEELRDRLQRHDGGTERS